MRYKGTLYKIRCHCGQMIFADVGDQYLVNNPMRRHPAECYVECPNCGAIAFVIEDPKMLKHRAGRKKKWKSDYPPIVGKILHTTKTEEEQELVQDLVTKINLLYNKSVSVVNAAKKLLERHDSHWSKAIFKKQIQRLKDTISNFQDLEDDF